MKFIGDFHIQPQYRRANENHFSLPNIQHWARTKGVSVVGTGGFINDAWLAVVKEQLEPAEDGLFVLKKEYNTLSLNESVRFVLTAQVNNVYKKYGKTRKIRSLLFVKDIKSAEYINKRLSVHGVDSSTENVANIDICDLLEMTLESSEQSLLVPANIWSPRMGILSASTGFDNIEHCFGSLATHIKALETGYSSEPSMSRACSALDKYVFFTNSQAQSLHQIGLNANIFDTYLSYDSIIQALTTPKNGLQSTIHTYPQADKYYHDGHRKCNINWSPLQTMKNQHICPVCKGTVTTGVANRIAQLADRNKGEYPPTDTSPHFIIPLRTLLAEITGVGEQSKTVTQAYESLIEKAGNELNILVNYNLESIHSIGNDILTEAIRRMRSREVIIQHGYDGEYGSVKVFGSDEIRIFSGQEAVFKSLIDDQQNIQHKTNKLQENIEEYHVLRERQRGKNNDANSKTDKLMAMLNFEQKKALEHQTGNALLVAGPGTGKTFVVAARISYLVKNNGVKPRNITVISFNTRGVNQIKTHLQQFVPGAEPDIEVCPWFDWCEKLTHNFFETNNKIGDNDKKFIIEQILQYNKQDCTTVIKAITHYKQQLQGATDLLPNDANAHIYQQYEQYKQQHALHDTDDVVVRAYQMLKSNKELLKQVLEKYKYIFIDDFQDITYIQNELLLLLTASNECAMFATGDPNQSVESSKGGNVDYIKRFAVNYPNSTIYTMRKSYRCSEQIVKASNFVLTSTGNDNQWLRGINEGAKIKLVPNTNEHSEAEFIAQSIANMLKKEDLTQTTVAQPNEFAGLQPNDIAVFCRVYSLMPLLKKTFDKHNIPYSATNEPYIYNDKDTAQLLQLYRLTVNRQSRFAAQMLTHEGFNLKKLPDYTQGTTIKDVLIQLSTLFFDNKQPNKELITISQDFGSNIRAFDNYLIKNQNDIVWQKKQQVSLMTLPESKGAEYKCVFVVGCENGLIPYTLHNNNESKNDEERRMLYVGMTRTQRYLYLTYAAQRTLHDTLYKLNRSAYISVIDKELTEILKIEQYNTPSLF